MAIIAILATAGLSAYTGYIKKARDTKRIADLAAINTIILSDMANDGLPPQSINELNAAILQANNNQPILDPLTKGSIPNFTVTNSCIDADGTTIIPCQYEYTLCDDGLGYIIFAYFESTSNISLYTENSSGFAGGFATQDIYDIGSCNNNTGGSGDYLHGDLYWN